MNVCCRCYKVKEKGRRDGVNFTCSDCLNEQALRARVDRRIKLPDGRVKYPFGHVIVPTEEE